MSLWTLSRRFSRACRRGEHGFSLLSTLLAVMILAVVLAIAVPRFSSALATANTVRIQADLTTLDTAIGLYQTAHGTAPTKLSDLEPYVTNAETLKPPSGNVILDGKESSLTNPTYEITTNDKKICRATCDGKTAEAFRPKE